MSEDWRRYEESIQKTRTADIKKALKMSDEVLDALAKRVVACRQWHWMPRSAGDGSL